MYFPIFECILLYHLTSSECSSRRSKNSVFPLEKPAPDPQYDTWNSSCVDEWVYGAWPSKYPCLRPLMEGQALGIVCASSVCARCCNTQTHMHMHTFVPCPFSLVFSPSITLPGVAVIELWQTSRVRPAPLPGGLAKWPFHYPTAAVFPVHR